MFIEVVENKALELGIRLAKDLNSKKVILEFDDQYVIDVAKKEARSCVSFGSIVNYILRIGSSMESIAFNFVGCDGNIPAQLLAKLVVEDKICSRWK